MTRYLGRDLLTTLRFHRSAYGTVGVDVHGVLHQIQIQINATLFMWHLLRSRWSLGAFTETQSLTTEPAAVVRKNSPLSAHLHKAIEPCPGIFLAESSIDLVGGRGVKCFILDMDEAPIGGGLLLKGAKREARKWRHTS